MLNSVLSFSGERKRAAKEGEECFLTLGNTYAHVAHGVMSVTQMLVRFLRTPRIFLQCPDDIGEPGPAPWLRVKTASWGAAMPGLPSGHRHAPSAGNGALHR